MQVLFTMVSQTLMLLCGHLCAFVDSSWARQKPFMTGRPFCRTPGNKHAKPLSGHCKHTPENPLRDATELFMKYPTSHRHSNIDVEPILSVLDKGGQGLQNSSSEACSLSPYFPLEQGWQTVLSLVSYVPGIQGEHFVPPSSEDILPGLHTGQNACVPATQSSICLCQLNG